MLVFFLSASLISQHAVHTDNLLNEEEIHNIHCLLSSNTYLVIKELSRSCVMKFKQAAFRI